MMLCFGRYESCIDVEIQQRAVEYVELSKKGAAFMDVLAEMPKFPERQVCKLFYDSMRVTWMGRLDTG